LGVQSLTLTPDYQHSGILLRETAPFADAVNVYNSFRRDVHVFVERSDPQPGPIQNFALGGARIETPAVAQKLQVMAGFASGDVPREAIKSVAVALPAMNGAATTYTVTVVGAGGTALPASTNATTTQKAREVARRTAIERFLVPTISSLLEPGAKERSSSDMAPILKDISAAAIEKIETGNFADGIGLAFRDLFNSSNLPLTIERVLKLYYPGIKSRDSLENMRSRLTRNLSSLIGATASSVSLNGNGIVGTIQNSKRLETFTVVTKPIKLRVLPGVSYLGKGGGIALNTQLQLPAGEGASGVTYRWSLTGVGAGYGIDGSEKVFPFETASSTVTYKHRDTINVVYGTDTIIVEALRTINGTPTVIASGSASVTVQPSVITLTPQTKDLLFGQQATFVATVNPPPVSGKLSYVFVTTGVSTFIGGAQVKSTPENSAEFRNNSDKIGEKQTVEVNVVLEDAAGKLTFFGSARAVVTTVQVPTAPGGGPTPPCASCIPLSINGK
jgi:hypothetical protein